jgi:hypothetical protein
MKLTPARRKYLKARDAAAWKRNEKRTAWACANCGKHVATVTTVGLCMSCAEKAILSRVMY